MDAVFYYKSHLQNASQTNHQPVLTSIHNHFHNSRCRQICHGFRIYPVTKNMRLAIRNIFIRWQIRIKYLFIIFFIHIWSPLIISIWYKCTKFYFTSQIKHVIMQTIILPDYRHFTYQELHNELSKIKSIKIQTYNSSARLSFRHRSSVCSYI